MGSRLEANSSAVRKRIEGHEFSNEEGEEYEGSAFGGFGDYFRRKKIKLQNLDSEIRAASTGKAQIFKGVVCHVNGYTQPSLNDLHHMIVAHGGGFIQYLDNKTMVTHIIASSLTPKKAVEFRRYRIVKPAWIVDSIAAGKLQPWDRYRVVDEGDSQKILRFENGKVLSQVNHRVRGYREQTETSWYTKQLADTQRKQESTPPVEEGETDLAQGHQRERAIIEEEKGLSSNLTTHFRGGEAGPTVTEVEEAGVADNSIGTDHVADDQHGRPAQAPLEGATAEAPASDLRKELQDAINGDEPSVLEKAANADPAEAERIAGRRLTAEEHNSVLLADPRIRKSSVLNPDFLEQYYRESRLHHLSAWKAELKSQLQALAAEKSSSQKALHKRPPRSRRYILHVDFDSFFVAVSLKNHAELVERPCVVAHGSGSASEIASCNYPARKFGIKNGMWMKRAHELCKDLKVLPYDFPGYEAASKEFYDSILNCGGLVQSVSIDEALVDISTTCHQAGGSDGTEVSEGSIWREQEKADQVAQSIRDQVKEKTGCAVSVGIGGNILLAKVALRKAKPAGQYHIKPEEVLDFLADLEVRSLPGVAYSIGGKLEENGITYVKDIRQVTKERMISLLGPKTGEKLWNYSRGIDPAEVGDQVIRKSVSAEVNWGVRFETQEQAEEFVENLAGELSRRLVKEKVRGSHLTMKIMRRAADAPLDPPKHLGHGKCDTFNKSIILGVPTTTKEVISKEALSVMRSFGFSPGELRGLGLQMTKLEPMKSMASDVSGGSQRRLDFFKQEAEVAAHEAQRHDAKATIKDDEDPDTPEKPKDDGTMSAFTAPVFAESRTPTRKRLNTAGTQFLLPTQVDQNVLKALPLDIRNRLQRQSGSKTTRSDDHDPETNSIISALPNQSQLDPSILDELPPELRSEILAEYGQKEHSHETKSIAGQSVLPQSPRKGRIVRQPVKRGRGRPRGGGSILSRLHAVKSDTNTLTQSNFVATTAISRPGDDSDSSAITEDISEEYLAALPEDIRQEVLEQHRKDQLARTGGIEVARKRRAQKLTDEAPRALKLSPREPRPSFTSRELTTIEQLRDAVDAWIKEFVADGPYKEDVDVLARYLDDVVSKEGDINKASSVAKWLQWCLERDDIISDSTCDRSYPVPGAPPSNASDKAKVRWRRALVTVKKAVDDAVEARGLAPLDPGWLIPTS